MPMPSSLGGPLNAVQALGLGPDLAAQGEMETEEMKRKRLQQMQLQRPAMQDAAFSLFGNGGYNAIR